jgi:hypothetical protein
MVQIMGKRIMSRMASLLNWTGSTVSGIFARGMGGLTPAQQARIDEMDRDYEVFRRQKPGGAKMNCSNILQQNQTRAVIKNG